MIEKANFPEYLWEGITRSRPDLTMDRSADNFDMDRLIIEVMAIQSLMIRAGVILMINSAPAPTLGVNGQFALDYENLILYGPKTGGDWGGGTFLGGSGGGGSDSNYVHNQMVAASTWSVTHNLNKRPSVTIVDSSGRLCLGEVTYIDDNNVEIVFTAAFSGSAYFN